MRLTKRQLKRIIREEYSRLQRRGLINESEERTIGEEEQDEFLSEQIAQYEGEICRTIVNCAMQGYMDQEDNEQSMTPESQLANACMFEEPRVVVAVASKCPEFADLLAMMKEEQQMMFGISAPDHMIFDLLVDYGIIDQCCEDFQDAAGG
tara:strand:- start:266 stop:718 length:453 start_codon:yes stop_codon:yes gene_type:complete